MFENRSAYRNNIYREGLVSFRVTVNQTDLMVHADKDLKKEATDLVLKYRRYVETYIERFPEFATTLTPWPIKGPAPEIVRAMIDCSSKAGVGPMASIAGAIAQFIGYELLTVSKEVIIENGGDIFLKVTSPVTIGLFAGKSPLSMKIGLKFDTREKPFSVCTSSGTIGHSLSHGKSDATCVISDSALIADAAATSIGNLVTSENEINRAINLGKNIEGVTGIAIISGAKIGLWGGLEVIKLLKNT